MRRCRKLISMIVMMAMLATMTPYHVLAADTTTGDPTDAAVETTPTVLDEQEEGTETEENLNDDEEEEGNGGDISGEPSTSDASLTENNIDETENEEPVEVQPTEETVAKTSKADGEFYSYVTELGESIPIETLAVNAGVITEDESQGFASNIEDVSFSKQDCVDITNDNGSWVFEVIKVFDTNEMLTITMSDGRVYQIQIECTRTSDFLNGDWAHINYYAVTDITDGTNLKEDDPLDNSYENRKVKTFDLVNYHLEYSTEIYDESGLEGIKEGYVCFKFVLPADPTEAEWAVESMGWLGESCADEADLNNKTAEGGVLREQNLGGYYTYIDDDGNQVICGKKYQKPGTSNEQGFPNTESLTPKVQVLLPKNGFEIKPKFYMWVEHNTTDQTCEQHNMDEVKMIEAEPVEVVSELRMNVEIKRVDPQWTSYSKIYDFDQSDSSVINYGEGRVYGKAIDIGLALQLYNHNIDDGLKGCALPEGDITVDMKLNTVYEVSGADGNTRTINLTEMGYTPLVYTYGKNMPNKEDIAGRKITNIPDIATNCCPLDDKNGSDSELASNITGSNQVWNGGNWTAEQTGTTISFTNSDYIINPNWFPNTFSSSSTTRKDYYDYTQGPGACDIGCFAALKVYVVYPLTFEKSDGTVVDLVEEFGAGTIQFTAQDVNLRANSSAGPLEVVTDTSNQKVDGNDDIVADSLFLSPDGTYGTMIRYNYRYTNHYTDTLNGDNYIRNGRDTASLGQEIGLSWGMAASTDNKKELLISAAQSMIKLDADAIQLGSLRQSTEDGNANVSVTYLYGAKADGENWSGIDEQNSTKEEDLIWYESLEDVENDNKKCVAVLAEWRFKEDYPVYNVKDFVAKHQAFVRIDESLTKKVYPIIVSTTLWNRRDLEIENLDINDFPSRIDVDDDTQMPRFTKRLDQDFRKAEYEDGTFTRDQNGEDHYGDSLYVVSYKAEIQKRLTQKVSEDASPHRLFDLDAGQRVADYSLSVNLKLDNNVAVNNTTTVTITDTLPKGLTYIAGSTFFGGVYKQQGIGVQGTVEGGESGDNCEPDARINADGTTTLTWVIPDAVIGERLPVIYYSCEIGKAGTPEDVVDNQKLPNTATVMTPEDNREPSLYNGKLSTQEIRVSKNYNVSVAKYSDPRYIEADGEPAWVAIVGNNSANAIPNSIMMDTLPAYGDSAGTIIDPDNKMKVKEWTISITSASNVSEWKAFYTTDANASKMISKDFSYDSAANTITGATEESSAIVWQAAGIDVTSDGAKITGIYDTENITGIAVVGTLKSNESYEAHVKLHYSDPFRKDDKLVNRISRQDNTVKSAVYVVHRALEGLVWKDINVNGIRESSEEVIGGVKATLMKLTENGDPDNAEDYEPYTMPNGSPAFVLTGNVLNVLTGETTAFDIYDDGKDFGRYRFDELPSGTFGVKFESGDFSAFSVHKATLVNASPRDSDDSDAVPVYDSDGALLNADITGITMPAIERLANALYISKYNDLGLYQTGNLEVSKTVINKNSENTKVEFAFTVTLDNDAINGTFGEGESAMTFEDGVAKFTLKDGEKKIATDLPEEIGYTVEETPVTNFTTEYDTNKTGKIVANSTKSTLVKNTYHAAGSFTPEIRKELEGAALKKDQFTFELLDANDKVLDTKKNDEDGKVIFNALKYTEDDLEKNESGYIKEATYVTYKVREVIPKEAVKNEDGTFTLDGYTYDGNVYTFTVKLKDNMDGTIEATSEMSPEDLVFKNVYNASGTLKLDAKKEFKNGKLLGGEFTFELKDAEGTLMQTKKNDAEGNVSFEIIDYSLEDVKESPFNYTVSEIVENKAGVKFDNTVYNVEVTLSDNGDGTLNVVKKVDQGGELVFVNEQLNLKTSITIGGTKVLKGKDLEKGQFKFVLTDESGKTVLEAKNDADGNFLFEAINYELADLNGEMEKVYTYGITEVNDGQKNISYDKTAYTVYVTVINNGDGTMTAKADKNSADIKFTNTYNPPEKHHKRGSSTGDSANGALWALMLLLAGGALAGTIWFRRRKKI